MIAIFYISPLVIIAGLIIAGVLVAGAIPELVTLLTVAFIVMVLAMSLSIGIAVFVGNRQRAYTIRPDLTAVPVNSIQPRAYDAQHVATVPTKAIEGQREYIVGRDALTLDELLELVRTRYGSDGHDAPAEPYGASQTSRAYQPEPSRTPDQ